MDPSTTTVMTLGDASFSRAGYVATRARGVTSSRMAHNHDHSHAGHSHAPTADADHRWLTVALALIAGFMGVEVVAGLLAGSLLYSLPFAVQPMVAGFQAVDARFLETAAGLGMPPLQVFRRVVLPMARASLITSAIMSFYGWRLERSLGA